MSDFLAQVVASRREHAREAKRARPEEELLERVPHNAWTLVHMPLPRGRTLLGSFGDAFTAALFRRRFERRLGVIAELKRNSPALGAVARPSLDVTSQIALYEAGGAAAISVLTEPTFWGGSLDDLRTARASTSLPILCKDVIVDEYQIVEARAAGADAVLLIAEALTDDELRRLAARAATLAMGTLIEAHEAVAFGRAVEHGRVVGVNARDLRNPQDIDIGRARQLHTFAKPRQILVAESGIASVDDARLLPSRVDAVLVGTALMREPDPAPLVRALAAIPREGRPDGVVVPAARPGATSR